MSGCELPQISFCFVTKKNQGKPISGEIDLKGKGNNIKNYKGAIIGSSKFIICSI